MLNRIIGASGSVSCANLSLDAHRRNKTELVLKEIKSNSDWTLEGTSAFSFQQKFAVTAIGGAIGVMAGFIPRFFNAPYGLSLPWFFAGNALLQCAEGAKESQNYIGHKLSKMASYFKEDAGSQARQNLAKGLKTIVKTAKEHTASRDVPELFLSGMLITTGLAFSFDSYKIPVFATGLAVISVCTWLRLRDNIQNDLVKVSQNVDLCLNILEKEKTSKK